MGEPRGVHRDRIGPGAAPTPPDALAAHDLVTAWGLLSEAVMAVSGHLSSGLEATGGPSLAEFDVLLRLRREPGHRLPLEVVAREIGLTPAGMSRLVNRMELDDLVATTAGGHAGSGVTVTLTAVGDLRVEAALERHTEDLRRHLLGPLGVGGLQALTELTRRLRDTREDGPGREPS